MRSAKGFTLIELTVVLALAAVLMGLVIVAFRFGGPKANLKQRATALGQAIEACREKAASNDRRYVLRIDIRSGSYAIAEVQDTESESTSTEVLSYRLPDNYRLDVLQDGAPGAQEQVMVALNPSGMLPPLTIRIWDETGRGISIRPDPLFNEVAYEEF